jgi:hypothetical protein
LIEDNSFLYRWEQKMALVLRIDVDKPYGRATILQKVISKMREDYWFPGIASFGYLNPLRRCLVFLDDEKISSHIYFRKCTLPPKSWLSNSLLAGHKLGLHAEDTRSFDTFKRELEEVRVYFECRLLSSFTKHGSGKWKGGRNHYPPYEPDKYLEWAESLGIPFLFGNHEDVYEAHKLCGGRQFYPGAFWIDRPYASHEQSSLQRIIDIAKERNLVVLMHCDGFAGEEKVQKGMRLLVSMARRQNVSWVTL